MKQRNATLDFKAKSNFSYFSLVCMLLEILEKEPFQQIFTCSKSTIETLEQDVEHGPNDNKETRTTSVACYKP